MGEKPEQIEKHIEHTRNELGDNLSELQEKVKNAVDWRAQFKERPMTMIGIAFGGGVLLSTLFGRRTDSRRSWTGDRWIPSEPQTTAASEFRGASSAFGSNSLKGNRSDIWENIKGALVGITARKVTQYLDELVPGFQEQYRKASNQGETSGSNGHDQSTHNVM